VEAVVHEELYNEVGISLHGGKLFIRAVTSSTRKSTVLYWIWMGHFISENYSKEDVPKSIMTLYIS